MHSVIRRRLARAWVSLTVTGLAAGLAAFGGSTPAVAAPASPCHIHGTILEGDFTTIESDVVHGNTEIIVFTHPIFFSGSLSGVGVARERAVVHLQTNTDDVHDRVAFTGTATCDDGRVLGAGGLEINFIALVSFVTNSFTAHFEVIGSTGGLAGTHGNGTVTGVPGVPGGNGPYDGTLR